MNKKILYLDMDGVLADFDGAIYNLCPDLFLPAAYENEKMRAERVNNICVNSPEIFHHLSPIENAIEYTKQLFGMFEIYFLSTPMWSVPQSFMGKRLWVEKHFGELAVRKLILTHRKDLALGDYLVDDRLKNGADKFKGIHIHFGTSEFPDWHSVFNHLQNIAKG